jgi:hypothetical protein
VLIAVDAAAAVAGTTMTIVGVRRAVPVLR